MTIKNAVTLGVDLGGTKIKTALVDIQGRILAVDTHPTQPEKGVDGVIADIQSCVKTCLKKGITHEALALGIGVAGQVDLEGNISYAPNLSWRNVPLKTTLEEALQMPVIVVNDVRAATGGEWRYGAGRDVKDMLVLFIGTGIGGGVVSDGMLLQGCSNTCGELGHMTIVANGRNCHCPNQGCLEAYAGGWAIAERAQEAVLTHPTMGEDLTARAGTVEKITAFHVSQAFLAGDMLACQLIDETALYLSAGIVAMVNAFNPCLFVLGGGVIEGLSVLISMIESRTRRYALPAAIQNLKFVKAALGGDAGVIGAAALAQTI